MSGNSPRSLLHIPPTDPPVDGYIAWRILRSGTLEGPAGWSFDPSAEGAMTTARPPLSLIICPCLSTDYCLNPHCHTLRRCSLTARTLCLRREEWDHDPPADTTRNLRNLGTSDFSGGEHMIPYEGIRSRIQDGPKRHIFPYMFTHLTWFSLLLLLLRTTVLCIVHSEKKNDAVSHAE